jgi:hypothetical protein
MDIFIIGKFGAAKQRCLAIIQPQYDVTTAP